MKNPRHKSTVKFSFTMTPTEAAPVLRALKRARNKSQWMRDAVTQAACGHMETTGAATAVVVKAGVRP